MSILIKGMEMPKSCWDCYFQDCGNCRLNYHKVVDKCIIEDRIDDDCPIIPVPPHGRLIDADALKAQFPKPKKANGGWRNPNEAIVHKMDIWARIDATPTIIPAEEGGANDE